MSIERLTCPAHPDVVLLRMKRGWYCEECGRDVLPLGAELRVGEVESSPTAVLLGEADRWPGIVAHPVAAALCESHPVQRLHRICDAAEIVTRFLVVVAIACARELRGRVEFPDPLAKLLRSHIQRPTLGVWTDILALVYADVIPDWPACAALRTFTQSQLIPLLIGRTEPTKTEEPAGTEEEFRITSLLGLRNVLVHAGPMTSTAATALIDVWETRFVAALNTAQVLASLDLLYIDSGVFIGLRGFSATPRVVPPPATISPSKAALNRRVLLLLDGHAIDLWPLCVGEGTPTSSDATGVYYRADQEALLFSVIGGASTVRRHASGYLDFLQLFHLDENRPDRSSSARDCMTEFRHDALALVGRTSELKHIKDIVRQTREGVLWLHGPAGIGKSYLAARVAVDLVGDPRKMLCVPWRFRNGDARCSRAAFLTHAVAQIAQWLARPGGSAPDDVPALEEQLRQLLGWVAQLQPASSTSAQPQGRPARVIFVLDGVDEIAGLDIEMAKLPFRLSFPNVVWLCVGRAEGALPGIFSSAACTHVFPDGVPPMSTADVRSILLDQPGSIKYALLCRDVETGAGNAAQVTNRFIDAVVARAAGLPLYVRLVVEDLLTGAYSFDDEHKLPAGLTEYYRQLLGRLSVGDMQTLVTPLVVLLALAEAPLDLEAIRVALVHARRLASGEAGTALLARALEHVGSLTRVAPTLAGSSGRSLSHDTLRTHVLEGLELANERALMFDTLCTMALGYGELPDGSLQQYLREYGPTHMLIAGRFRDFVDLLAGDLHGGCMKAIRRALLADDAIGARIQELAAWACQVRETKILSPVLEECCEAAPLGRVLAVEQCLPSLTELCALASPPAGSDAVRVAYLYAVCARLRGNLQQALARFARIPSSPPSPERDRIVFEHANAVRESGNYERAARLYEELFNGTGNDPSRHDDHCLFAQQYADLHYVQGRHLLALELLTAIEESDELPTLRRVMAEALRIHGHVWRMNERLDRALELYERARSLFELEDDVFGVGRIETNCAETLALVEPDRALVRAHAAEDMNQRLGMRLEVGKAINAMGLALHALGNLDGADKAFRDAEEIQRQVGYRSGVGMVWANRVHLHLTRGSLEQARTEFLTMSRLFRGLKAYPYLVYRCGRLLWERGVRDRTIGRILHQSASQVQWPEGRDSFDELVLQHYRVGV